MSLPWHHLFYDEGFESTTAAAAGCSSNNDDRATRRLNRAATRDMAPPDNDVFGVHDAVGSEYASLLEKAEVDGFELLSDSLPHTHAWVVDDDEQPAPRYQRAQQRVPTGKVAMLSHPSPTSAHSRRLGRSYCK